MWCIVHIHMQHHPVLLQDYRPGLTRADVEAQQRAQRRAEGRADDAAPERSHAQHAKTFDGPPPRGSGEGPAYV